LADTGKINIDVQKEVDIQATENVTLNSASANVNITAGDTVNVQADGDINIDAADNLVISAGNITLTAADGTIILGDLEIADLEARLAALEAGINDPTRDGYSVAEISIYIRSATIPPTPAGGTYNFANQTLTGDPLSAGWTQTVPGGIYPVWMSRAVAYAAGSNGTDATLTWSTPGQVFSDGEDGISVNVIFKRSPAQPATPADTPSADPIPSGWVNVTEEIPSGADPIWASYGSRPNQNADWVWGTPIKVEGRDGATPADGTAVAEIAIYAKWPVGGIQNWTSPPQPIGGSYDFGTRPPTLVAPVYTSDQTGLYNVVLWTQDIPLGEGDIYTSRGIASAPANGVDNEIIWSVPVKTLGTGQSLDVVFLRAFSRPPTPARSLESPPNGTWESHPWVSDVAETSGDAPLWASFGKKSSESSNYWVWDRPFKVEADDRFTVSPAADVFLIACDAQGNAKAGTSAPSITIGVLRGTVDLTTDSDITYTIKTETNCDASLGSTLATRNVLTVPLNTINANNASVVVSVKFGGVTIAEIPVRMVKVLDGDNTPFALYSSAGVFKYDSTNTPFPDEQTISFEVFTGSLVGSPTVTATYYDDSVPQRTITQTFTVGQGLDGKYEFEVTDEEFESPFDIAGVTFSSGTNSSNWGVTQSVRVEAALGGFTDTITIIRLTDGLAGLVGRLSNEAISFSAPSTGVVDTDDISEQGYGYFEVYQGLTDVLDKADANGLEFSVLTAEIVPAGAATVTINNTDGSPDKGKYQITAIQAGNRNISVPLQATYNGQTVRKILSISIVTDGANAINYNFSNPAHVFPTSAGSGGVYNVTDYSNSGSILRVFDGVEALDFVANPSATLSAGQFKVTTYLEAPSDSITPGAITVDSFDTTKAVVADHSDMSGTVDVAIITYNIDGKRLNGDAFQIEIVQSLAKARQGASGGLDGATVARVFAYKRATDLPTGSAAYPANDYTYEFQRNQFINVATNAVITDLDAGWSTTIPSGTEKLWVIVATAMSVTATTLVEGGSAGDWSEPVEFSRNGVNTASVPIFIRTSGELPVIEYNDPGLDPNDYSKYRFSTASFIETGNVGDAGSYALPVSTINGASVSWSATPPETGGDYLWVAWATAANSADTDLVYHGDWADNVSLLSQNGTNAVGLSITADSLVFTRRQDGTISPTYVKLNVQRQSVSDSIVWSADPNITLYPTLTSGVPSGTPIIEGQSQVSDDEVYMKSSDFLTAITNASTNYVRVSATAGSYNDTVSIFLLEEGKNAITTVVANIVHGIPGNPNGTVNAENYLGSGTTIDVYEGSEKFAFVRATSNVPPTLQARQFTIGAPILSSVGGIRVGGVAPNNWWNAFILGTGGTANVIDHSEFNTSLQLIVISYPITLKKSDGTVVTVNATQSIIKINQIPGADGLNNVVQFAWKRSATDLPSDDAPNTEVSYNFANKVMYVTEGQTTDALGSNGWSRVVPSGTDQLWVVAGTFSSSGETDSISPSEWSQPEKVGADGLDGFNTATVTLYKRTNTATVPAKPVSTITTGADANGMRYFFNTGSLTGLPTDWFRTPAAAGSSATGRYLWVSNATALGREESDLIVNSDWSTPQDISVNGIDGKIVRVTSSPSVFKRTSTGTVTPDYVKIEATRQGLTGSIAWTATTGVTYYSLLAGGYTPITNLATHTGSSIYIKNDSYTDLRQVISVTASVTDGSVSYSDTISVPLLADGTSAITVQVLNDNHSIPADSAGNVAAGDYVGSGTEITVYEGASQLTFISNATVSTLALGQWTIDSTYDGNAAIEPDGAIVRGGIVTGRDSFHGKINDHSAFLQSRDVATITYKVLVKARSGGGVVSYFYPVQTITKTTAGETTLYGYLTNEYQPIPASSTGIVETGGYNGAGGYFKVLEGNDDVTGSCVFSVGTTTPAGITATISNDPITRGLYAVTGGMNGVSSAKVPFTATYLGRTVTKEFSVGLQRAGTPGSGFSAKVLTLNVDRNTVTYDSNGDASPSGQIIQAQAVKGGGLQASPAWEVRVFYLDGTIKSSVLNVDAVGVPSYIQGDTLYLYESDIRTVSGFTALYTKITITATEDGVNFTDFATIVKVRDGLAAKNVSLSTTSHLFNVSKTGTIDPSIISLYAKDSNLASGSTPTFAISINSTDGSDGTWVNATTNGTSSYGLISSAGSDVATIDSSKFSVDSAMVRVTWDGITDFLRISKAEEGTDALYTISTNPAHVLASATDGTVTDVTGANTTITLYRGTAPVTENGWAWTYSLVNFDFDSDGPGSSGDTGNVYAVYPSGRSQANSTSATIVVTGMGTGVDNGYIDATVSKDGVSRTERFSLSKSKRGSTGDNAKSVIVSSNKDTIIYNDTVIQPNQSNVVINVIDQYIDSTPYYIQMKTLDGGVVNANTYITDLTRVSSNSTTITANSAVDTNFTLTPANFETARGSTQGVVVEIYANDVPGGANVLSDSLTITRLVNGSSAVTFTQNNGTHTVSANSEGGNILWTGSGQDIAVYEGSTALTFGGATDGAAASTFYITGVASSDAGITVGNRTSTTSNGVQIARVAAHSGTMTFATKIATITYTIKAYRANGTAVTGTLVQTISRQDAATNGTNGLTSAVLYAYKRSSTALTADDKPSRNVGTPASPYTYSYNFSTKSWTNTTAGPITSGQFAATGWYTTIPSGTDTLYVTIATASTSSNIDEIVPADWQDPQTFSAAGINAATVYLYQRTSSATAPTVAPVANAWRYTFASGLLEKTGTDNVWSSTIPASGGDYIWVTHSTAFGTGATDSDFSWSPIALLTRRGAGVLTTILSNETHVIPANADGSDIAGSYSGSGTRVSVLDGTDELQFVASTTAQATLVNGQFTIFSGSSNLPIGSAITPGGVTVSGKAAVIGNHSVMTADSATVSIPLVIRRDGINTAITAVQSLSKTRNASSFKMFPNGSVFTYNTDGGLYGNQTIEFTFNTQNLGTTAPTFAIVGYVGTTPTNLNSNLVSGSGSTRTITSSAMFRAGVTGTDFVKSYDKIVITGTAGTLTDSFTITRIKDGNTVNGAPGADGKDSINGTLSNESATLVSNWNGDVDSTSLSAGGGTFQVYRGTTAIAGNATAPTGTNNGYTLTFAVQGTPTNCSVSINNTSGVYSVSGMTSDNASATFRATYTQYILGVAQTAITIDKVLSLTKSRGWISMDLNANKLTMTFNEAGVASPANQIVTISPKFNYPGYYARWFDSNVWYSNYLSITIKRYGFAGDLLSTVTHAQIPVNTGNFYFTDSTKTVLQIKDAYLTTPTAYIEVTGEVIFGGQVYYKDTVSITRLTGFKGDSGDPGADGDAGRNAIVFNQSAKPTTGVEVGDVWYKTPTVSGQKGVWYQYIGTGTEDGFAGWTRMTGSVGVYDRITSNFGATMIDDAAIGSAKIGSLDVQKLTGDITKIYPVNYKSSESAAPITIAAGAIDAEVISFKLPKSTHPEGHTPTVMASINLLNGGFSTFKIQWAPVGTGVTTLPSTNLGSVHAKLSLAYYGSLYWFVIKGNVAAEVNKVTSLTVGTQTVAVNPYPSSVVNIQEQIDIYENYNDYEGGGSVYSPTVIRNLINTNYGIDILTDTYRGDVTLVYCNNIIEYNKVVQGATVTRGGGTAGAAVGQPDGWRTLNTGFAGFGTAIASFTSKVKEDVWIRLAIDNPNFYSDYYGPVALNVDLVTMIVMGVR
jgi:hypothetical protein